MIRFRFRSTSRLAALSRPVSLAFLAAFAAGCSSSATFNGDGLNDCGPTSNESCAVSLLVTGGTFYRGYDTASPATISDFRLDKVTVHTLSGGADVT